MRAGSSAKVLRAAENPPAPDATDRLDAVVEFVQIVRAIEGGS